MSRVSFLRNIGSNWLVQFWLVGWGLVMVPIYLKFLGNTEYGVWILINAVVGHYGLLSFGTQQSIVRYVARYLAASDERSLNEAFNTAFLIQTCMGAIAVAISFLLAWSLPMLQGFAVNEYDGAAPLMLLVGLNAAVSLIGGGFGAALAGAERFDVSNTLLLVSSLVTNLSLIAIVVAGGGLIGMASVLLVLSLVDKSVSAIVALRFVPELRFAPKLASRAQFAKMFRFGVHAFVIVVGDRLRFFSDTIVIGIFMPAAAIPIFAIGNRPLQFLKSLVRGATRVLTPAFGRIEATGAIGEQPRLLIVASGATALLSFLGSIVLVMVGDRLIHLWVGPGYAESFQIMLIMIPAYMIETSLAPAGSLLFGTSGYRVVSWLVVIEGLMNLILSLSLIGPFGLVGVALGTAIPMILIRLIAIPLTACRTTGIGLYAYLRRVLLPPAIPMVVAGAVASGVMGLVPESGIMSVLWVILALVAAYCLTAFIVLWRRQDELLAGIVRKIGLRMEWRRNP